MSKLFGMAVVAVAALVAAGTVQAQGNDKGNWLVRARALHLDSANGDNTGLKLSINNKTFAEVDISYFFAPSWAAELVLTYPQKHTIYSNGTAIGTLKHLPPTLLGQYHFTGPGAVRPYVGVGVNYTNFSSVHFNDAVNAALHPNVKRSSWGAAAQVGVDVAVGSGWVLNLDVKKVQIETDVYSGSTKAGTFKVDPVLVSVGAGLRF